MTAGLDVTVRAGRVAVAHSAYLIPSLSRSGRLRWFYGVLQSRNPDVDVLDFNSLLRMAEYAIGGPQARRCRCARIDHDLEHRSCRRTRSLLEPGNRLPKCSASSLPVGFVEFRLLHPSIQRLRPDAGAAGGLFDIPLREQRLNRRFLLAAEFCAVAYHLRTSAFICWRFSWSDSYAALRIRSR